MWISVIGVNGGFFGVGNPSTIDRVLYRIGRSRSTASNI